MNQARLALVAGFLMLVSALPARLPSPEQIRADLQGIYATTAPQLLRTHGGQLSRRLEKLLHQQADYLVGTLHPWEKNPRARLLTEGGSNEHNIRPNAQAISGLAILARAAGDETTTRTRRYQDATVAVLRFLLPTHGAGGVPCGDGRLWHNQWQSALWAHSAGRAAWLVWDDLDPELRWLAARMVCDEADRFTTTLPPAQVTVDTKAEENAWNSTVISLAANMFPRHPHRQAWDEAARRWAVSAFTREADLRANPVVDGLSLKEWGVGANIFDDYTLENHHRVHPDYMSTFNLLLSQRWGYEWAGRQVPEALSFNARPIYNVLKTLSFPDGGWVYANGQDWQLRRNPEWIETHTAQATLFDDPEASRLLRELFPVMERMAARTTTGPIILPSETYFPSSQAFLLEQMAHSYLLLLARGEGPPPVSADELWRRVSGRHVYGEGKLALLRTPRSVSTFSWGSQVMGTVLPLDQDLLLAPYERSLIGTVTAPGVKGDPVRVREVSVGGEPDMLTVAGVLDRAGGAFQQRFAFVALPDGRTVYADVLRGINPPEGLEIRGGTLHVLNDPDWPLHDGTRTLFSASGQRTFTASGPAKVAPVRFSSPWYNLDDKLGIVPLMSSGDQEYVENHVSARSRVEQPFHLSTGVQPGQTALAHTALVFYPGQNHEATSATAAQCRILPLGADGAVHQLLLEDGTKVVCNLEETTVTVTRAKASEKAPSAVSD